MLKSILVFMFISSGLFAEPQFKSIYLRLSKKNLKIKKNEKIYFHKKDRWVKDFSKLRLPVQGAHYCELSQTRQKRNSKKVSIKKSEKEVIEFVFAGGRVRNQVLHYISRDKNLTLKCKETMMPPIEHYGSDLDLVKNHLKKYFEVGECLIIDNPQREERIVKGLSLYPEVLAKRKKKFINRVYKSKKNWIKEREFGGAKYFCLKE
ncbi:hypothetical protein N9N67_05575 [Bacteriovoracaceae bacterium]|nr:hypothetical protein [Bacteriovoracaceae bacterium]